MSFSIVEVIGFELPPSLSLVWLEIGATSFPGSALGIRLKIVSMAFDLNDRTGKNEYMSGIS